MEPLGHAQSLQSAIEHDEAADTEYIVARFDDLAHTARGDDITRSRQASRRGVGRTAEGIDGEPQRTREKRAVGERRPLGFDELEISRS